ncbi:MAG TPA: (2Fe-2S)-binding protein [Gammaproteobacteria bacterium]|nr:(2Fe-2S)-binding protein [Gammaproteobacteria bacterium]|tara:strand:+ start:349 stop:858 length:510 start_codon:yes stop_codon:yes gene_type:complete
MKKVADDELVQVHTSVNGRSYTFSTEPRVNLADALRYELGLLGTKVGCEHGVCGACTILVDGKSARSCLMLGLQAEGREISTIEGWANGKELNPLQESFRRHHALQCGFCTSGFLATATELLRENPNPTREEVRERISGNLCRCTGYETIVDAICDPEVAAFARDEKNA